MKRLGMLLFTFIMILATITAFAYENSRTNIPDIQKPYFDLDSSRFGTIKNIVWLDHLIRHDNSLLILSLDEKKEVNTSCLY